MTRTSIEWATDSWNPIAAYDRETGKRGWFCTKVSPGCTNCYAEQWNRFRGNGHLYRVGNLDKVRFELAPTLLDPLHWRKPRRVFVNSMTDLFLEAHTDEMVDRCFGVMAVADRHQFLVLTKRPERMRDYFADEYRFAMLEGNAQQVYHELTGEDPSMWLAVSGPLPNVWLGVSVENQEEADLRIPFLVQTPAAIRFLSCEPLLGPIDFYGAGSRGPEEGDPESFSALRGYDGTDPTIPGIDWVIVGGESGAKARVLDIEWMRDVLQQCHSASVPVFVKQLGRSPVERTNGVVTWPEIDLRDPKGGDVHEWPPDLRVRQYPAVEALV